MPRSQAAFQNVGFICGKFELFSFNKRLEDFGGNLRAYNDYLEEVEELSMNAPVLNL